MAVPEVTAIIPVFNDRPALERAIPVSLEVLAHITDEFEVIVAEDGSSEGSTAFVREYEKISPRVISMCGFQMLSVETPPKFITF